MKRGIFTVLQKSFNNSGYFLRRSMLADGRTSNYLGLRR